jgi:putative DNA primase/helicase
MRAATDCLTNTEFLPLQTTLNMPDSTPSTLTTTTSIMERQRAKIPVIAAAPTAIPHEELISSIAAHLSPIDLRVVTKIPENGKLTSKHYILYTVKSLLDQLKAEGFAIGFLNDALYLYNRAYFKQLPKNDAKDVLSAAALVFGVPELEAEFKDFKQDAYEQLCVSAPKLTIPENKQVAKINLRNGTVAIDVETGEVALLPFSAADVMRYQLPFAYDPNAKSPVFDRFLAEVQPSLTARMVLAEWQGYVLIPYSCFRKSKLMMLLGEGSNGKSVYFEVVTAMMGRENVSSVNLEDLTTKEGARADIADKRLNYAPDISKKLDAANFKTLSSGEPIQARRLYKDPFTMTDYAKLQFNCNIMPSAEHTHGFHRRFLISPFNVIISAEKQDETLQDRIVNNELPGVFNWALDGLKRLLKQRDFTKSEEMNAAADSYLEESDSIVSFMRSSDGYTPDYDETKKVLLKDMFADYLTWCKTWNVASQFVDGRKFKKRLEGTLNFKETETKSSVGVRMYARKNS